MSHHLPDDSDDDDSDDSGDEGDDEELFWCSIDIFAQCIYISPVVPRQRLFGDSVAELGTQ